MTKHIALSALLIAASTALAAAQGNPNRPAQQRRAAAAAQRPDSQGRNRAALEGQVRSRLAQVARRQLGLTDAQVQKLQATNTKFAARRRVLMEQERDIRMSLRDELITGDSARQKQVGDLMDRMVKAQRQRIDLLDEEQKDLATYLTPVQRARLFGLEEDLRRRMQQMRQDAAAGRMGGPGGRGGRGRMAPGGPPNPDDMPMGGPPQGTRMQMAPCPVGAGPCPQPAQGQLRPRRPNPDAPPAIKPPIEP